MSSNTIRIIIAVCSVIAAVLSLSVYLAVRPRKPTAQVPKFTAFGEVQRVQKSDLPTQEFAPFRRIRAVDDLPPYATPELEEIEAEPARKAENQPSFSGGKQEFYNFTGPYAVKLWRKHKILPSVTIAQTAIETGYGRFTIGWNLGGEYACCQRDDVLPETALQYEIHGYTATAYECPYHPGRCKTLLSTNEWDNGGTGENLVRVKRWFSYYRSIDEFLERRYKLFTLPIYSNILGETDYIKAANCLTYYAKASVYIPAVIAEIEKNNLNE